MNKPVAWMWEQEINGLATETVFLKERPFNDKAIPLYTHPVKELTDEEIEEAIKTSTVKLSELEAYDYCYPQKYRLDEKMFAKAILRKAQEK